MPSGLAVRALELRRGRHLLARSLSFELPPGGLVELTGPNGSGKSTLLRVLCGLGRLEAGELLWDNSRFDRASDEHRSRTLYLAHSDGLKGALSGEENLELFAALRQFRDRQREIQEGLGYYEMDALKAVPCVKLSQGQKRRIALSRLWAFPARLWLLDEPTTSLDRSGIERFADHLSAHLADGGMAIVATHQRLPARLKPTFQIALGTVA